MMFCSVCGLELPDGVSVCPQCGNPVGATPVDATLVSSDGMTRVLADDEGETHLIGQEATHVLSADQTRVVAPATPPTPPVAPFIPQTVDDAADARQATGSFDDPTTVVEPPISTSVQVGADARRAMAQNTPEPDHFSAASQRDTKKKMSGGKIAAIVIALLVVVGAAVGFGTYQAQIWGGKSVPSVVGMDPDAAQSALIAAGFTVERGEQVSDDSVGKVLSTDPTGNARADTSKPVKLVVGVARTVPDVTGKTLDDAKSALSDAGLSTLRLAYQSSSQTEGTVISTDPAAGTAVKASDQITVTVAQAFTIPDVVGMSEADAKTAIEAAGLKDEVTYTSSDKNDGTVLSTNPAANTKMAEGSTVTIEVSIKVPSSVTKLADFFTTKPESLSTFLSQKGYEVRQGSSNYGIAYQISGAGDGTTITFCSDAYVPRVFTDGAETDTLAAGLPVKGINVLFPYTYDLGGKFATNDDFVQAVMNTCGLSNATSSCDANSFITPTTPTHIPQFICKAGTTGDYTWTVLVVDDDPARGRFTQVSLTPTSAMSSQDMSSFNNSLADYTAYLVLFTS